MIPAAQAISWFVILCLLTIGANGYFQQGEKLVGLGPVTPTRQADDVSISDDGNTVIIAAPLASSTPGGAFVFKRSENGVWSQHGPIVSGTLPWPYTSQMGRVAAISGAADTLLLSGNSDNVGTIAAWILVRNPEGTWKHQTRLIAFSTGENRPTSAALSKDGNTAIISSMTDNKTGAAWIFFRDNGTWAWQSPRLVGTGAVDGSLGAEQGISVALSGNGDTAIIGGYLDNNDVGAAWIFVREDGEWFQQGPKLVGSGVIGGRSYQGRAVDLSYDGNTALIGGFADNSFIGARVWTQQAKLVGTGVGGKSQQGAALSLSSDGNVAAIGGYADNGGIGATWVFKRLNDVWTQQGQKLVGSGYVGECHQGHAVALSADGSILVVSGYLDDNDMGATWVFDTRSPSPTVATNSPSSETFDTDSLPPTSETEHPSSSPLTGSPPSTVSPSAETSDTSSSPTPSVTQSAETFDTSSPSPTSETENPPSSPLTQSIGLIVGLVAGSLLLLVLGIIGFRKHRRRPRQQNEKYYPANKEMSDQEMPSPISGGTVYRNIKLKEDIQRAIQNNRTKYVASICRSALERNAINNKKFAIFISYHQDGAGSDANVLYDFLVGIGIPSDIIFFDKESLSSINSLSAIVKASIMLIQLQSSLIYTRPFTLIEAYEAIKSKLVIVPVALGSYDFDAAAKFLTSPDFATVLDRLNPGTVDKIVSTGNSVEEIGKVLGEHFPGLISWKFTARESKAVRNAQLHDIAVIVLEKLACCSAHSLTLT